MTRGCSFTEYIKNKFYNVLWSAGETFLTDNLSSFNIDLRGIHKEGDIEVSEVEIKRIWIEDRPNMEICFDVALSISFIIKEGDYHYDNYEEHDEWVMFQCRGDLGKRLEDFEILEVTRYNGKNPVQDPLDDSLVPILSKEKLEDVATDFLKIYYPTALYIPSRGESPVWVDPSILASQLDLTVIYKRISEDSRIFGQIFFEDADVELYSEDIGKNVFSRIKEKTILVDPNVHLLRNFGSLNNTIIHECVHWVKHLKAFKLEQLFHEKISCIICEVSGTISTTISQNSANFMEFQANQLAPRIQMPKEPFLAKTKEYISFFMQRSFVKHAIDVMEDVIIQLGKDFHVSRQAAKIRLVELNFEDAIGTFNYVDNHYVRPHGFKKSSLKINQTFSISKQDAAIQRVVNAELREKVASGDYIFVENHYVYYAPLYVEKGLNGNLQLTNYARSHMDECCLVFDMSITSSVNAIYHTICYLNRGNPPTTTRLAF